MHFQVDSDSGPGGRGLCLPRRGAPVPSACGLRPAVGSFSDARLSVYARCGDSAPKIWENIPVTLIAYFQPNLGSSTAICSALSH